jgi:leucyl aminopeptidase
LRFEVSSGHPAEVPADALVLPCQEDAPNPALGDLGARLGIDLASLLSRRGFRGEKADVFELETLGRLPADRLFFVGLGQRPTAAGALQQAVMVVARRLDGQVVAPLMAKFGTSHQGSLSSDLGASASALAEGLILGGYRFDRYKHEPGLPRKQSVEQLTVIVAPGGGDLREVRTGLHHGEIVANAVNWARDLVNTPPGDATPADLADEARVMASEHGMSCKVWEKADLQDGGFGGVLGVGQGSSNEPRLVELTYEGTGGRRPIGLAGKGITFDSGGLSLKRPDGEIQWMKSDMAGAATMMALLRAVAELNIAVNLHAVLPFAENLPGGSALRPGDVVEHRGGRTAEVVDTDSEGRLVVADALAYLLEKDPVAIVDAATLTDAAGFGPDLWAVTGNDRRLAAEIVAAGEEAGDAGWEIPLPTEYRRYLKSPVADLRNCPDGLPDTTVSAAVYLSAFTAGVPWTHIDNGSTAYLERETALWPVGATGSPTRALIRWIEKAVQSEASVAASGGPVRN